MNFPGNADFDRENIIDGRPSSAADFDAWYFQGATPTVFSLRYPPGESLAEVRMQVNAVLWTPGVQMLAGRYDPSVVGPSITWGAAVCYFTVILAPGEVPEPLLIDTPPGGQAPYATRGILSIDEPQSQVRVEVVAPDRLSLDYLQAALSAALSAAPRPSTSPLSAPTDPSQSVYDAASNRLWDPSLQQWVPSYDTTVDLGPVDDAAQGDGGGAEQDEGGLMAPPDGDTQ